MSGIVILPAGVNRVGVAQRVLTEPQIRSLSPESSA
jgi:hypothetical protein